jgi:hypothetical protein
MADLSMDDYSEYSENDSPQPVKIKVIILFNSIIISRYVRVVGYVIYKKERERIRADFSWKRPSCFLFLLRRNFYIARVSRARLYMLALIFIDQFIRKSTLSVFSCSVSLSRTFSLVLYFSTY